MLFKLIKQIQSSFKYVFEYSFEYFYINQKRMAENHGSSPIKNEKRQSPLQPDFLLPSSLYKNEQPPQIHAHSYLKILGQLQISRDSQGHRRIVNQKKQEYKIVPSTNNFFQSFFTIITKSKFSLSQQKIKSLKQTYQRKYKVNPNSIIYNYYPYELEMIGQLYFRQANPQLREAIYTEYAWKIRKMRSLSLGVGIHIAFSIWSRNKPWLLLTSNYDIRLICMGFAFLCYTKFKYVPLLQIQYKILKHPEEYQRLARLYESDKH